MKQYYGGQTELTLKHFPIGEEHWPKEMIFSQALIKRSAAQANTKLKQLDARLSKAIQKAATEVMEGKMADQFPETVWQGGSGTQFNMNVNEVVASRANEILGKLSPNNPAHPNNHVNMSQSTNDTVPTAIHIASVYSLHAKLLPSLDELVHSLSAKATEYKKIEKTGRTHLQDAVTLTLGQEFSGYAAQLEHARLQLVDAAAHLLEIPIGGTAVGTGLNAPKGYQELVVSEIDSVMKLGFVPAENLFESLSAHDRLVHTSGALRTLAIAYLKIANDIRWLGSGPRAGLGELLLPENEPGSSIMPGKVNPTQCEQAIMVACQVLGNDAAVGAAATTLGNFQVITAKPLFAHNILQSIRLLGESMGAFEKYCVRGIRPNKVRIDENLKGSLSEITKRSKEIGYDAAAERARGKKK